MDFTEHIGDMRRRNPAILPVPELGLYVLYFDSVQFSDEWPRGVLAQCSPDLMRWSTPQAVYTDEGDFRGTPEIRSPRVFPYRGNYVMTTTQRYETETWSCLCLVSDSPLGPFRPAGEPLTTPDDSTVDGTLYLGKRGRPWLIYSKECPQAQDDSVCALPLEEDLSAPAGPEIDLFSASEAIWGQACLTEDGRHWRRAARAPWPHRCRDGSLLLLWTGDSAAGSAVGCARSRSEMIFGPWDIADDPLYGLDGASAMTFESFDGRLIMALHSPEEEGAERILLFEMEDSDGALKISNELTGNWYPKFYRPDDMMKVARLRQVR